MIKTLLSACLVLATGCVDQGDDVQGEPALPRALGTVTAADGLDVAGWSRLELRFSPLEGILPPVAQSFELSSAPLPYAYAIGGGLGANQSTEWRLDAWLTNATGASEPATGEPAASTTLQFACTDGCPSQGGIDLVVD